MDNSTAVTTKDVRRVSVWSTVPVAQFIIVVRTGATRAGR